MSSERARSAAAVAFGAALVWFWITAPHTPLLPVESSTTAPGLWLVNVLARIPWTDPIGRVAIVAIIMSSAAAAGMAWLIERLGYPWLVAVGCALAVSLGPSSWRQAVGDAPGAAASVLVVCAVAAAWLERGSALTRAGAASLAVMTAAALSPAALAVAPLIVGRALSASRRIAGVGIVAGLAIAIVIAVALRAASSAGPLGAAVLVVRNEWLLPGALLLMCGALTALWGTPLPVHAVGGTLIAGCLMVLGISAAALAVFPAIVMAHALHALPAIGPRTRIAAAILLVFLQAMHRWQAPAPETWRLIAWRDAVERAIPRGARIATGVRGAAALNGPLFAGRSSDIHLVYAKPDGSRTRPAASFVLDDLHGSLEAAGIRTEPVTLTFTGAAELLRLLPPGTFVGIGVSEAAAAHDPAAVVEALGALGHVTDGAPRAVAAVGIAGSTRSQPRIAPGERTHVLIGERVAENGRRSPADFEVIAASTRVGVRFWGRELAAGSGWAVIAIAARGPLIGVYANDDVRAAWRLEVPGLGVSRVVSAGEPLSPPAR